MKDIEGKDLEEQKDKERNEKGQRESNWRLKWKTGKAGPTYT